MKAIFIGTNGSMDLKHGQEYEIKAINHRHCPIALEIRIGNPAFDRNAKGVMCPYDSLEALFKNWRFKQ